MKKIIKHGLQLIIMMAMTAVVIVAHLYMDFAYTIEETIIGLCFAFSSGVGLLIAWNKVDGMKS